MPRIALLQMTSGIDPAVNAATLIAAIRSAAGQGAVMLFTPEMSGLIDRDRARAAASIVAEADDPVLARVCAAAAEAGIWVHLGSLAVRRADGRFANRGFVIDPAGTIRARYDKLHLFDVDLRREKAGVNPRPMPRGMQRSSRRPRSACWAHQSVMTCDFPICTAR